eukprot:1458581-Karenia_brevis.AAC.1
MVAIVQQIPSRKVAQGGQLVVSKPTAQQQLEAKGHQMDSKGQRLYCLMCGQEWAKGKVSVGGDCPGPSIWGFPQRDKPWLVPTGHDIQW